MKTRWVKTSLAASISTLISTTAFAQSENNQAEADVEKITVHGMHRAYQGAFEYKEVPAAAQDIDLGLISDAGAINLNDALDLSASVARQNNFGCCWYSFCLQDLP